MTNDTESQNDPAPEIVWHITPRSNMESIQNNGLTAAWGNYACADLNNAAKFTTFSRLGSSAAEWIAIEIATEDLDFERSYDHSPTFFGTDDSWVCWEKVPPENILNYYEVTFGTAEEKDAD